MVIRMDISKLNDVQWYEGMLLCPQHFQHLSASLTTDMAYVTNNILMFAYGVDQLKIDTSALANGVIRILKMSGIFQDGMFFDFDAMKDSSLERDIKKDLDSTSEVIKIHLAVSKYVYGENLIAGNNQRYYTDVQKNSRDTNTGANPKDICILKPKLQILLEDEIDARFIHFPLLHVKKTENNGIDIVDYIPPSVIFYTHSKVIELLRTLVTTLRNKISFFADRVGNSSFVLGAEIQSGLKSLISATLPLEALLKLDFVSPFLCYQYLLKTAAELAAINVEQTIPSLPKYEHENILSVFSKLVAFCEKSITYIKQPFVTIPFEKEDRRFKLKIEKNWLMEDVFFVSIKRKFSQSDNDLLKWIDGVQIASESNIEIVRERRILGAERKVLERGENIVPPHGAVVLEIKSKNQYISASEHLYFVNNTDENTPEEIVFYVKK